MKICQNCKHESENESAKFCSVCGSAIIDKVAYTKTRITRVKSNILKCSVSLLVLVILVIGVYVLSDKLIIPANNYSRAKQLFKAGDYDSAQKLYAELGEYKDAQTQKIESIYRSAMQKIASGDSNGVDSYTFIPVIKGGLHLEETFEYAKETDNSYLLAEFAIQGKYLDEIYAIVKADIDANYANHFYRSNGFVLKQDVLIALSKNEKYEQIIFDYAKLLNSEHLRSPKIFIEFAKSGRRLDDVYQIAKANIDTPCYYQASKIFSALGNYEHSQEYFREFVLNYRNFVSGGGSLWPALKHDGSIDVLDDDNQETGNFWNRAINNLIDIVSVEAGYEHVIALRSNGTVLSFPNEYEYRYSGDVSGWENIIAISAGGWGNVGLKADGTVVAVGDNESGQHNVEDWRGIVAISAQSDFTVGLKTDGTVVAVGDNYYGQCDVGAWSGITAIATGYDHTLGLKSDGTVIATGANYQMQSNVENWQDITYIAALWHMSIGIKSDGTVVSVGNNKQYNAFGDY
ncbi:hypothetical protein FACS189425_02150 [Clostridia bacterium]|nr:hypothetical protein FACS189425_02150 [Clostridia bacterium]